MKTLSWFRPFAALCQLVVFAACSNTQGGDEDRPVITQSTRGAGIQLYPEVIQGDGIGDLSSEYEDIVGRIDVGAPAPAPRTFILRNSRIEVVLVRPGSLTPTEARVIVRAGESSARFTIRIYAHPEVRMSQIRVFEQLNGGPTVRYDNWPVETGPGALSMRLFRGPLDVIASTPAPEGTVERQGEYYTGEVTLPGTFETARTISLSPGGAEMWPGYIRVASMPTSVVIPPGAESQQFPLVIGPWKPATNKSGVKDGSFLPPDREYRITGTFGGFSDEASAAGPR